MVSSDGPTPVSIAVHGNLVYVANAGAVGPNYTGFTLNPGGQLEPLANSTVSLPNGSQPGDVLFNSIGNNLVGTRVGSSLIDSFVVGRDGLLTAAPGSPSSAQGLGPFGSEFRPTDPQQLFVSNAHNVGAGTGTISAFNVGVQRGTDVDRGWSFRRQPDSAVLGRDHPQRPVPVHGEHRFR